MIALDYHLHSRHSADCQAELIDMCEAAEAHGLRDIAFTEHLDFDREDPTYGFFRWDAFAASLEEARGRFAGRLVIRAGLEFDFRRAYGPEVGETVRRLPLDLAIGSVHTAAGCRLYRLAREPPPDLDLRAVQDDYFAEVEALVESGWCQVLGHFDYIYKQLPDLVAPHRDARYWQRVERILAACIRRGVALEVNTHHLLDRGLGLAADVEILGRYRRMGGRLVTVGSDAHLPGDVAHAFDKAEKALRLAGFDAVVGFDRGRPYAVPIT